MRGSHSASPHVSKVTPVAVQGKLVKPAVSIWDYCYFESDTLAQIEALSGATSAAGHGIGGGGATGGDGSQDSGTVVAAAVAVAPSSYGNEFLDDFELVGGLNSSSGGKSGGVSFNELQRSINSTEKACRDSIAVVDSILNLLQDVNAAYDDVTSRTNSLMVNCENLLEQQHTYQQTVEILNATLEPFNDIEAVSKQLGIPFDTSSATGKHPAAAPVVVETTTIDPRSAEFKQILERLAKAGKFLDSNQEILDKRLYFQWLESLENRAMSLVGRAMRELIEKAAKNCADLYQAQVYQQTVAANKAKTGGFASASASAAAMGAQQPRSSVVLDDKPIESAPVYQKFRGLGYRLRELSALLVTGSFAESVRAHHFNSSSSSSHKLGAGRAGHGADSRRRALHRTNSARGMNGKDENTNAAAAAVDLPIIAEVKEGYVTVRNDLLVPFIKDTWTAGLEAAGITLTSTRRSLSTAAAGSIGAGAAGSDRAASLCSGIRYAFATLLRVTQLEQQLFNTLFTTADNASSGSDEAVRTITRSASANGNSMSESAAAGLQPEQSEVLSIVQTLSNAARDFLRPYIIHESSVDELCRIVSALSEDVRAQMLSMPVPSQILRQLLRGLDGTVNDAKERLSYCAEMSIRTTVQLFEPLPSQLAYPDILEAYVAYQKKAQQQGSASSSSATAAAAADDDDLVITDVYQTWYPPMRDSLSLLSKLYGVVEMGVFEDFARRVVNLCVDTLRAGSEGVKRSHPGIHGDLFLVRHLLILREQLVPFELRLQGVEKRLDFSTTGSALQQLLSNAQSMWRFDESNGFLQLARSGVPRMQETQIDVKRDLDSALKTACFALKHSAVKMLLGAMDGFLAKVTAFVGAIPTSVQDAADQAGGDHERALAAAGAVSVPLLPAAVQTRLKSQAFVRPERIKEMLQSVQSVLLQRVPDLKAMMELYIDNSVARTILLKPILQDFNENKRKMECIIASCLDAGQPKRDVEHLLQTLSMTVVSELTNG